jgi:hypothetical protein
MFGPSATVVHQGTYFTIVGAMAASYLAFWSLHPAVAIGFSALEIIVTLIAYVCATPYRADPAMNTLIGLQFGPIHHGFAAAALLSAGLLSILLRPSSRSD